LGASLQKSELTSQAMLVDAVKSQLHINNASN